MTRSELQELALSLIGPDSHTASGFFNKVQFDSDILAFDRLLQQLKVINKGRLLNFKLLINTFIVATNAFGLPKTLIVLDSVLTPDEKSLMKPFIILLGHVPFEGIISSEHCINIVINLIKENKLNATFFNEYFER
jgi:hypothetical protein